MKKYRLKKWYPSLHKYWVVGDVVVPWKNLTDFYHTPNELSFVFKDEVENNPDFWELIEDEEPLFVTEDGVSIYTNNIELFAVNDMFETASSTRFDFGVSRKEGWKLFYHESNADEYIWRNKRVFSYKDIQNYGVHPVNMIRVGELAKERIEK